MNTIPSFINPKALTIVRTCNKNRVSEVEARDPEGDSFVIRRESSDVGNTCAMPRVQMGVTYTDHNKPEAPVVHKAIGEDESYKLWSGLKKCKTEAGVDRSEMTWIMADLQAKAGVGGAC